MLLSFVELTLLALLAGGLWLYHFRHGLLDCRQRRLEIEYVVCLRRLLEHLPQHRGAANTLLRGDESFRSKLQALQQAVDKDMGVIQRHPAHVETPRWRTVASGWANLHAGVLQLSPPQSFAQHTALITEVIHLIDDANDRCGLAENLPDGIDGMLRAAVTKLPPLLEALGQARAIGAGAAAEGRAATTTRVKLLYLNQRIEQVAQDTFQALEKSLGRNLGGRRGLDSQAAERSKQSIDALRAILDKELIQQERIRIAASDYFASATRAVDDVFRLFDAIASLAADTLDAQEKQQGTAFVRSAASLALLMVGVAIAGSLSALHA